ncbi:hypothetical protein HY572_02900 [Candidatus Micrarchaeota archaeon]|nr:hypothetical protein [Candidatus Micrarchaeota archaeon]
MNIKLLFILFVPLLLMGCTTIQPPPTPSPVVSIPPIVSPSPSPAPTCPPIAMPDCINGFLTYPNGETDQNNCPVSPVCAACPVIAVPDCINAELTYPNGERDVNGCQLAPVCTSYPTPTTDRLDFSTGKQAFNIQQDDAVQPDVSLSFVRIQSSLTRPDQKPFVVDEANDLRVDTLYYVTDSRKTGGIAQGTILYQDPGSSFYNVFVHPDAQVQSSRRVTKNHVRYRFADAPQDVLWDFNANAIESNQPADLQDFVIVLPDATFAASPDGFFEIDVGNGDSDQPRFNAASGPGGIAYRGVLRQPGFVSPRDSQIALYDLYHVQIDYAVDERLQGVFLKEGQQLAVLQSNIQPVHAVLTELEADGTAHFDLREGPVQGSTLFAQTTIEPDNKYIDVTKNVQLDYLRFEPDFEGGPYAKASFNVHDTNVVPSPTPSPTPSPFPASVTKAKFFVFDRAQTCLVGDACTSGNCCTFGSLRVENNANLRLATPTQAASLSTAVKQCGSSEIDAAEFSRIQNQVQNFSNFVRTQTHGALNVETEIIHLDSELELTKVMECRYYPGPWNVRNLLSPHVKPDTDFEFVIYDEDYSFGQVQAGSAWTLALDSLGPDSIGGAGYSSITKNMDFGSEPLVNFITNEWGWQFMAALKTKVTDPKTTRIYAAEDRLPACGQPEADYLPTIESCGFDPDYPACSQSVCPDTQAYRGHVLSEHYNPAWKFIGNHCRDGKKDFGEQGIDCGGQCPACIIVD